jgi:cytochrome P450
VTKPLSEPVELGVNEGERYRNRHNATGVVNDPHTRYDELRLQGDVHSGTVASLFGITDTSPTNMSEFDSHFTVVGYDAGDTVFRRHDVFSSELAYQQSQTWWGPTILGMDEPEHRRYRALAQPAFAVRTMDSWRDRWLMPVLDSLIDDFEQKEKVDLYNDYCARFPAVTIASGFGAKSEDVPELHDLVLRMGGNAESPEEVVKASQQVADYVRQLIDQRQQEPGDDIISLLVTSEFVDEDGVAHRLTEVEIRGFANLMLTAGSGTTYRSMGMMLLALLERPELLERVRRDRSLIQQVVEEVLRWEPPVAYFRRVTREDTELCGVPIPARSEVAVSITAANHDPRKWDRPHEFDPFRPIQPHLAFASGPHFCIGNQLARMELSVALNRLLDRIPLMELDPGQPRPFRTGLLYRMPTALPVLLRPKKSR